MRHLFSKQLGFALIGLLMLAWLPQPAAGQGQSPRILQGVETDEFESVGIVGSQFFGGFCSGTLISDSHVLTAAHCAEVIEGPTAGTFEVFGQVYESIDVFIHPDYNPRTLANDIAIIQLGEPVIEALPSQIFRGRPLVGDLLLIVGFGGTGTAEGGSDGTFGTKRVGTTTIDSVTDTLVSWTYDDPSEANTAAGDSGGPGFLDLDGELFIACITSGGTQLDSSLGDFAFNTRVDAYADWIDFTVAASMLPEQPDDEPIDEPIDDPGVGEVVSCDSLLDCLFGDQLGPFPVLQLLIEMVTAILDWLTDLDAQLQGTPESEIPDQPAEQPGAEQPGGDLPGEGPVGEQPDDPPSGEQPGDVPGSDQTVQCPVSDPETEDPVTEDPGVELPGEIPDELPEIPGEVPEIPGVEIPGVEIPGVEIPGGGLPVGGGTGQGGSSNSVTLPPADATRLEIRRWMLEHPSLRDLVKHRLQ